jgi:hypothetical protein
MPKGFDPCTTTACATKIVALLGLPIIGEITDKARTLIIYGNSNVQRCFLCSSLQRQVAGIDCSASVLDGLETAIHCEREPRRNGS